MNATRLFGLTFGLLTGCVADGDVLNVADGRIRLITEALPPADVGVEYQARIEAAASPTGSLAWMVQGDLPPGLAAESSGLSLDLVGVPEVEGNFDFVVVVQNVVGTRVERSYTLVVRGAEVAPLVIETSSLARGFFGVAYADAINASGGNPPYEWSVVEGSLAPGLVLSATTSRAALIEGVPEEAGSYFVTLQVQDDANQTAGRRFELTIDAAQLVIDAVELPPAFVGVPFDVEIRGEGGQGALTWAVDGLPAGLGFAAAGSVLTIEGTPSAAGTFSVEVTVRDAAGTAATNQLILEVVDGLAIIEAAWPEAEVGVPYEARVVASPAAGGHAWRVVGALPSWLRLEADGPVARVVGVPEAPGEYMVTIEVRDAVGRIVSSVGRIDVAAPLEVTSSSLGTGTLGEAYRGPLSLNGGRGPYTWTVSGLPAGLRLEMSEGPTTALVGVAGQVGVFTVAVEVRDRQGRVATRTLDLTILDSNIPLTIDPVSPSTVNGCEGFHIPLRARGGANFGYTWRFVNAAPPGIELDPDGTPSTLLAGLLDGGRWTLLVEVRDSNGAVAQREVVVDAGTGGPYARTYVVGGLDVARQRGAALVVDACRRTPAVVREVAVNTSTIRLINADMSPGSQRRWLAVAVSGRNSSPNPNPATWVSQVWVMPNHDPSLPATLIDTSSAGASLVELMVRDTTTTTTPTARVFFPGEIMYQFMGQTVPLTGVVYAELSGAMRLRIRSINEAWRGLISDIPHPGLVMASVDGARLVAGFRLNFCATVIDPTTPPLPCYRMPSESSQQTYVGLDASGRFLFYYSNAPTLRYADLRPSGAPVTQQLGNGGRPGTQMDPSRRRLLIDPGGGSDFAVALIEPTRGPGAPTVLQRSASCRSTTGLSGWMWSADGRFIACAAYASPSQTPAVWLWSLDPVNPTPTRMTPVSLSSGPTSWRLSPQGDWLAFRAVLDPAVGEELAVVNRTTLGTPQRVTVITQDQRIVSFSPDGRFLAVQQSLSRSPLWIYDLSGAGPRLVFTSTSVQIPEVRTQPRFENFDTWRADSTGVLLRAAIGYFWLDLIDPSAPRLIRLDGTSQRWLWGPTVIVER